MTSDELTATLQRLNQAGRPLNITAAKRHYPEVVTAAFSQVPFLGWRRALLKAGIDPEKTHWELVDAAPCGICHKAVKNMSNHVLYKHGVPWKDYLAEHPKTVANSEVVRAANMKKVPTGLRHWEPVPSPEYALDRLRGWYDAGHEVHHVSIMTLDGSLYNQLRRFWPELSHDDLLRKSESILRKYGGALTRRSSRKSG